MKKLLLLLLLNFMLWSCTGHKPAVNHNNDIPVNSAEAEDQLNDEKLVLNNGLKWKVDNKTDYNVHRLLVILDKTNNANDKTLLIYRDIQGHLQAGIDTMIAQCKMEGPDHLALHKWLEPLMIRVAKLKKASTLADARLALKTINEQVGVYAQYFECSTDSVLTKKKR